MTEPRDIELLAAMGELTQQRIRVDVAEAWEHLYGHRPAPGDWVMVRAVVQRLEREGLIRSDPSLDIEVTDAGRAVLEPRNSA